MSCPLHLKSQSTIFCCNVLLHHKFDLLLKRRLAFWVIQLPLHFCGPSGAWPGSLDRSQDRVLWDTMMTHVRTCGERNSRIFANKQRSVLQLLSVIRIDFTWAGVLPTALGGRDCTRFDAHSIHPGVQGVANSFDEEVSLEEGEE